MTDIIPPQIQKPRDAAQIGQQQTIRPCFPELIVNLGKLFLYGRPRILLAEDPRLPLRKRRTVLPQWIDQIDWQDLSLFLFGNLHIPAVAGKRYHPRVIADPPALRQDIFDVFFYRRHILLPHRKQCHAAACDLPSGLDEIASVSPKPCFLCRHNDRGIGAGKA